MGSITTKVEKLVDKYKTNCPFKIAQNLGIEIVYENLGNTLGYFTKNFRIKIIHINENTSEKQREFVCSHELGHAVLHPDANTPFLKKHTLFSTDRIEVEANKFAVELLFNKAYLDEGILLEQAIKEYSVPKDFIYKHLGHKKILLPE